MNGTRTSHAFGTPRNDKKIFMNSIIILVIINSIVNNDYDLAATATRKSRKQKKQVNIL